MPNCAANISRRSFLWLIFCGYGLRECEYVLLVKSASASDFSFLRIFFIILVDINIYVQEYNKLYSWI